MDRLAPSKTLKSLMRWWKGSRAPEEAVVQPSRPVPTRPVDELDAVRERVLLRLQSGASVPGRGGAAPQVGGDSWTMRDAFEGVQVFGATGSGKTSGSGAALARAYLDPGRGGMGGLVLTAKEGEADAWRGYLRDVGRDPDEDLVEMSPSHGLTFNFLEYEAASAAKAVGGVSLTQNLVSLFMAALSTGDASVSRADPYWNDALTELLVHTVDLLVLAGQPVTLEGMIAVVRSAPDEKSTVKQSRWHQSPCGTALAAANARRHELSADRLEDLRQTVAYWLNDFPGLNSRTRSIVVSSLTSKIAGLLRSPLRKLLCTETSAQLKPETTHAGKVIVLNLPVMLYAETGRFAQVLYKTVWQRATARRKIEGDWRPVFLWADEAQYFVTSEDALFQQTARSQFAATVYLTQNLPNYTAALGGHAGQAAAESLLGNLQTKIFHANGDPTTNEWAQRLFGSDLQRLVSSSTSGGPSGSTTGSSVSQSSLPLVPSVRFTQLAKGGTPHGNRVEGILFQGGRRWSTNGGRNWVELGFDQG